MGERERVREEEEEGEKVMLLVLFQPTFTLFVFSSVLKRLSSAPQMRKRDNRLIEGPWKMNFLVGEVQTIFLSTPNRWQVWDVVGSVSQKKWVSLTPLGKRD